MTCEPAASLEPVDWSADARSRTQTRAVLMAMSRKRDFYFRQSIPLELAIAVLTLGLWPMLMSAYRFDRWRRLEWIQYTELMRWIAARTADVAVLELAAFADRAASRRSLMSLCQVVAIIAVVPLVIAAAQAWGSLALAVYGPSWLTTLAALYGGLIGIGWLVGWLGVIEQRAQTNLWLTRCNELLAAHDKRPVPLTRPTPPWALIVLGVVLGGVGPIWAGALVVVIALQNRYIIATRGARLAFVERMLEWMDRSGLPVEFDVEEMEPDAIAAVLE